MLDSMTAFTLGFGSGFIAAGMVAGVALWMLLGAKHGNGRTGA